jgi:outer membrane lipoprotein-sorting protein
MKKLFLMIAVAIISLSLNAQDLASIVKKYENASGADKLNTYKTIVMEGNMDLMGMQMSMVIKEKRPDKIKTVMDMSGTKMITVINGDRGYQVNPMMGSNEPTPLPAEQIAQAKNNRNLGSNISNLYKDGKLELAGEDTYRGTPVFKLKMITEMGDIFTYIDKDTYLVKGMQVEVSQGGVTQNVESVMSNYQKINGVMMAMKIDAYISGTYGYGMIFTKIEFDTPIDDSEFEIK